MARLLIIRHAKSSWDDPDLGIDWMVTGTPILSEKDAAAPTFRNFVTPFRYEAMP